ncbi:prolyl 4-hydroxylase subunit alpha-1 isoform X2 [Denticeps clupeoides]|uniref:prolyl 4-hydroxylase subunit alpha-1 isoform X2 n=1 Tax=Denticeps clupeoides TaxID=299321 RepID=UPI0010A30144|nr:prolyl 4-hydroxylase subunit alpha-1-like isoform X2 [Denticeps clupeoides]
MDGWRWLILTFLALQGIGFTNTEYYSSTEQMIDLIALDKELQIKFELYIYKELEHVQALFRVLRHVKNTIPAISETFISNPLTAYKFIEMLINKWNLIEEHISQSPSLEFIEYLDMAHEMLPDEEDLFGVALGLFRVQEIYNLYPEDVIRTTQLSTDDAVLMSKVAYRNKNYKIAYMWLNETFKRLEKGDAAEVEVFELARLLASSSFIQGHVQLAIDATKLILEHDQHNEAAWFQQLEYRIHQITHEADPKVDPREPSNQSYQAMCRWEANRLSPQRQKMLFCRYSNGGGNPHLIYSPMKEEDEWDNPRIIRYHNFITDKEIDHLKKVAKSKLQRSETSPNIISNIRVSKSAFLSEEDQGVYDVTRRIEDVTGLDMETAEPLQVANYGIGGHYSPHLDLLSKEEEEIRHGNRMATFQIYMSDVELGGATVFPTIGATLKIQKGSAVLWYNLLYSGEHDVRSLHAGCPVYLGNKWIATKWIHGYGQEFRRRCSLSELD